MKILITGDKGFIASKLKERLYGHEIVGYDIVDGKDLLNLEMLEEAMEPSVGKTFIFLSSYNYRPVYVLFSMN